MVANYVTKTHSKFQTLAYLFQQWLRESLSRTEKVYFLGVSTVMELNCLFRIYSFLFNVLFTLHLKNSVEKYVI